MSFVLSVGAGVPHLESRVLHEVTVMLEDHIKPNGSTLVRDLQQFASGALLWAGYKARFGEPASNQEQESSAARPTITSMTEEEMQRTRHIGDSASGLPSLAPSDFQVRQTRR
ncbi:hypothetical protein GJ744_007307 [Endocarpon pusillum]|uniref:Uncharacterized protein n=1 Tax=Endocarpon pusillum TaxID=364733 RepID=A0A8H7AJ15_9EURO|nr:hypothetical protein GJ744_007307 [Endocarpon pusillum]